MTIGGKDLDIMACGAKYMVKNNGGANELTGGFKNPVKAQLLGNHC